MKFYKFEIQSLIDITIEAETPDEALNLLQFKLEDGDYDYELGKNCCVSDAKEVTK